MNIQELEKRTGITRQNIRFYEKKGLLHPSRNSQNNYREYTEEDVKDLQTVKMLRKLAVSLEDIGSLMKGEQSLEEILQKQLLQLREKQKELDAGIRICQELLQADLSEMEPDEVLQKMESIERKGGRFMSIINDFKKVDQSEASRQFSFWPDTMVMNREEFTQALFQYAEENHLNLVITKEGMYPVFEIDGVEYTAWREFRKGLPGTAVICCKRTDMEESDQELSEIPEGRRRIMKFVSRYLAVILLALYLLVTERPLWLVLILLVGMGPIIYWTCRGR